MQETGLPPPRRSILFAAGLALLTASTTGRAATFYVAANVGDDAAAGAATHPWRSLGRGLLALHAGDTLVVKAGRYLEPLKVSASGRPGAPITLVGEGMPLIEANEDAISLVGSYIRLKGFEAHSSGWGSAIAVGKNNHHIEILGNIARDSACGGIAAVQTDYLTIDGNRVFGNARRAPWQCSGISIYEAMAADRAPGFHNVIRNNVVYDNMNVFVDEAVSHSHGKTTDGNGVIIDDSDHTQNAALGAPYDGATLIENNVIFDNGGRGVHIFHSRRVVVLNNTAYHDLKDPNLEGRGAEFSAAFSHDVVVANNIAVASPGQAGMMDGYASTQNHWDGNYVVASTPFLTPQSNALFGRRNTVARESPFIRPTVSGDFDFQTGPDNLARKTGVGVRIGGPSLVTLDPGVTAPAGLTHR